MKLADRTHLTAWKPCKPPPHSALSVGRRTQSNALGHITDEQNLANPTADPVDHIFGFTGRERDEESDLNFYRARYYDPAVGRFISQDPIGFDAGDANLYRYVGNGPTNATDPSGFQERWDPFGTDQGDIVNGKSGEIRGPNEILDEIFNSGHGTRYIQGRNLDRVNIKYGRHANSMIAAGYIGVAMALENVLFDVVTCGVGHSVEPVVEVIGAGWKFWRRSRIAIRYGDETVELGSEFIEKYRASQRAVGQDPGGYADIARELQDEISYLRKRFQRGDADFGSVKHYWWTGSTGIKMDLQLDASILNGRLILNEAHLTPCTMSWSAARGRFGRKGMEELAKDLARLYGVRTIDIPNGIGRVSGKFGSFGNSSFTITDGGRVVVSRLK